MSQLFGSLPLGLLSCGCFLSSELNSLLLRSCHLLLDAGKLFLCGDARSLLLSGQLLGSKLCCLHLLSDSLLLKTSSFVLLSFE